MLEVLNNHYIADHYLTYLITASNLLNTLGHDHSPQSHFCIFLYVCKHLCTGLKYHHTFEVCSRDCVNMCHYLP